jgi:hypothetical protein
MNRMPRKMRCGRGADVVYHDTDDVIGDACETSIVAVHA